MVGNREPVRLVAYALQQVEALAGARQDDRAVFAWQPYFFQSLGEPAHRDVGDAEVGERSDRGVDLAGSAVDDDQARRVGELALAAIPVFGSERPDDGRVPFGQVALEPAGDDFVDR